MSERSSALRMESVAFGAAYFRSVRSFVREPKALVGVLIVGTFVVLAVFAPIVAPYGENEQEPINSLSTPTLDHPLGTDRLGRDILSRLIFGARTSVSVGLIAVSVAVFVGSPMGLAAGFFGKWVDEIIMRFVDAWIAFPNLILLLGIVAIIGPGVVNVMIAIGLGSFPVYARLIRGQTLSIKQQDYVLAARALGASNSRIIAQHILPNAIQPVIVQASLLVGYAVLAEAGLSFLGIGAKPPTATWGVIIAQGFPIIRINPLVALAPGICIILFVLGVNFIGDRLRDVLDPRLRGAFVRRTS